MWQSAQPLRMDGLKRKIPAEPRLDGAFCLVCSPGTVLCFARFESSKKKRVIQKKDEKHKLQRESQRANEIEARERDGRNRSHCYAGECLTSGRGNQCIISTASCSVPPPPPSPPKPPGRPPPCLPLPPGLESPQR